MLTTASACVDVRRFAGRTALITGAGRGIGHATALEFAREGANIVAVDIDEDSARVTAEEARRLGVQSSSEYADVADPDSVRRLFAGLDAKLDIAVNNAGILPPAAPIEATEIGDFDRTWQVNARGVLLCLQHEIRVMKQQGGGVIVNVASLASHVGIPGVVSYVAAKHAVMGMTKVAALELARHNVRVHAVSPGAVDTAMMRSHYEDKPGDLEHVLEDIPIGRLVKPEEVARSIVFLASPDAAQLIGHTLFVDGGCVGVKP